MATAKKAKSVYVPEFSILQKEAQVSGVIKQDAHDWFGGVGVAILVAGVFALGGIWLYRKKEE